MTPRVAEHIQKSRECLLHSHKALSIGLTEEAGRLAYISAFHAAQAMIVANGHKAPKTHNGVHSEFARLTRDAVDLPPALRQFLSQAYALKNTADYEIGPSAFITKEDVEDACQKAELLLGWVSNAVN